MNQHIPPHYPDALAHMVLDAEQTTAANALHAICGTPIAPRKGWPARLWTPRAQRRLGVYLWGSAGRGKTTLAQAFYHDSGTVHKKHWPLHALMRSFHAAMHTARSNGAPDPLALAAQQHAADLLYIDEFEVSDITDAMIWARLLQQWQALDVCLLITSNRRPADLYVNGLNRELFVPAIGLLHAMTNVISLEHGNDYRREKLIAQPLYVSPMTPQDDAALRQLLHQLARSPQQTMLQFVVQERVLQFEHHWGGVLCASFHALFGQPLGAADYAALAQHVHALYIPDMPALTEQHRNEAVRFRKFIDVWYEQKRLLLCCAQVPYTEIYQGHSGAFEFARTISRLHEMQTAAYITSACDPSLVQL